MATNELGVFMFSEKMKRLLGVIYRQLASVGKRDTAGNRDLLTKTEAYVLPGDINDLFVKDFDLHIHYTDGLHPRRMELPEAKRRITAVEIYMLCPRLGAIHHGSDAERFINWFSELQMDQQCARRMAYQHGPRNVRLKLEFVSTAKCNDETRAVEQDEGGCEK
ncbi:MAG: hypothetical protein WAW41_09725 [Methylobacter sp.]